MRKANYCTRCSGELWADVLLTQPLTDFPGRYPASCGLPNNHGKQETGDDGGKGVGKIQSAFFTRGLFSKSPKVALNGRVKMKATQRNSFD
jgi:hypothetical protein